MTADESSRDVSAQCHHSQGSKEILLRSIGLGTFLFNLRVRTH